LTATGYQHGDGVYLVVTHHGIFAGRIRAGWGEAGLDAATLAALGRLGVPLADLRPDPEGN